MGKSSPYFFLNASPTGFSWYKNEEPRLKTRQTDAVRAVILHPFAEHANVMISHVLLGERDVRALVHFVIDDHPDSGAHVARNRAGRLKSRRVRDPRDARSLTVRARGNRACY